MGKKKRARLAITVCATESYCYAMRSQARRVAANLEGWPPGAVFIVGDKSEAIEAICQYWTDVLPAGWNINLINDKSFTEHRNYKERAQMVIARMRTLAFTAARKWCADLCWSLDSDVLPPENALRCMAHMLDFDGGYYGVSTCSYPNESFLGGSGTPANPINPNFYWDEFKLPELVENALAILDARMAQADEANRQTLTAKRARIEHWITRRNYAPKGNVFYCNGEFGWRPRGWLEHQYPGIGKGAVVPTDWCGFGCTLMGKSALAAAHFEGYDGKGTEDLWVCWKHWRPAGIRINVITHAVCDHVIHQKKKGGSAEEFTHIRAFHETEGPSAGHIRTEKRPWLYD